MSFHLQQSSTQDRTNKAPRCEGCGAKLIYRGRGRVPKWCSEPCRKRTLYSRPCAECGKPMNGSDGLGSHAPTRCLTCSAKRASAASGAIRSERARPRHERILQMWNAGATYPEMCAELDVSKGMISSILNRMRARGYDVRWGYQACAERANQLSEKLAEENHGL